MFTFKCRYIIDVHIVSVDRCNPVRLNVDNSRICVYDLLRDFRAVFLPVFRPIFLTAFLPVLFFAGTFAPLLRASESPIAIACLRLVTLFPLRPLFSVPLLRSRMALATLRCAAFPYFFAIGLEFVINARDVKRMPINTGDLICKVISVN